jgi:hypothetical protein
LVVIEHVAVRQDEDTRSIMERDPQDDSLPLDDRWAEISRWLEMTAGQLQSRLGVPGVVASDVRAAIGRRNRVAHDAWML